MQVKGIETKEIEETIGSLPDVISCKVIAEEELITEVHVLAENSRNAKQISRDIQSAIISKFDVDLDYKKISVAQIDFQQNWGKSSRPEIKSVGFSVGGNMAEVIVELLDDEEIYVSKASGFNTPRNVHRLLAEATISCINNMSKTESKFILEGVRKVRLVEEDVFVAGVSLMASSQEIFLSGAAVVRKDDKQSVVKAVLDAINRKVMKTN
ncbi:MAG TPA: hypothetical protein VJ990_09360 [Clostridia bacterium]|nr:hypothetical protein [Clostridia bacterium]